jgi:hypothetical protein
MSSTWACLCYGPSYASPDASPSWEATEEYKGRKSTEDEAMKKISLFAWAENKWLKVLLADLL